jgi:YesN/AraC family two-component response regulator
MLPGSAILCVDDEQIILHSLRDQISKHFGNRYIYEFAESGEEAWEVIEELTQEEIQIIIIICDWLMPGIKGDEFFLQVHQRFPNIFKIMLSGHADRSAIERAFSQAHLDSYIPKPWDEQQLIGVIESGLKKFYG